MKRFIFILAIFVFVAGCSQAEKQSEAIDPPPNHWSAEVLSRSWTEEQSLENQATVVLYAQDAAGYVVPFQAQIPADEKEIIPKTLEYMVAEGPGEQLVPEGFTLLLPAGTELKQFTIVPEERLITVDFTKPFANYSAEDERKLLEALTWALTEFDEIEQVQVRIDGNDINEMPVAGYPLSSPLSRTIGINIEREQVIHLAQSTPVLIYFQNKTIQGQPYYVPITRMVNLERQADHHASQEALVVIKQLIKGPATGSGLQPIFPKTTVERIEQVEITDEGHDITVSFPEELLMGGKTIPHEILAPVMLSLKENLETFDVRIGVGNEIHDMAEKTEHIAVLNQF